MVNIEELEMDIYDKILFCFNYVHTKSVPYYLILYLFDAENKMRKMGMESANAITNGILLILDLFLIENKEAKITPQDQIHIKNAFESLILV